MTLVPDTIAAQSTPPGLGAIAVVRLSGARALDVLRRVAPELEAEPTPRLASLLRIRHPEDGEMVDRALVTIFPGPHSYTGEDVVEISGHGGWIAPTLILDACLAAGARQAAAGEFTRRAYLNGKLDLVQAEAVLDLVEGRSRALHHTAVSQLERGLSGRIGELRAQILHLEALLVHHIDFPEEDDAPVPVARIGAEAQQLATALEGLLSTAPEGELLREGALTVLAGRPNSGKSSLFNALVGEERAIVTESPGTTRDALEAVVSLGSFPFRVVDTAGIREGGERVERMGIEVARRYLHRADLVLLCLPVDAEAGDVEEAFLRDAPDVPVVIVRTKADLRGPEAEEPEAAGREGGRGAAGSGGAQAMRSGEIRLSVLTGEGMEKLRARLPALVYRGLVGAGWEAPVLTRRRQSRAIRGALEEVRAFREALVERRVPPEVASAHLKEAESLLEETVGSVSTDAVLDQVFRNFCIGK